MSLLLCRKNLKQLNVKNLDVSHFSMNMSVHIGNEIRHYLAGQQRSVAWLAEQICYDPSNLRKLLKNRYIHTDLLYRISVILGKDFFACYSQLFIKDAAGIIHPNSG